MLKVSGKASQANSMYVCHSRSMMKFYGFCLINLNSVAVNVNFIFLVGTRDFFMHQIHSYDCWMIWCICYLSVPNLQCFLLSAGPGNPRTFCAHLPPDARGALSARVMLLPTRKGLAGSSPRAKLCANCLGQMESFSSLHSIVTVAGAGPPATTGGRQLPPWAPHHLKTFLCARDIVIPDVHCYSILYFFNIFSYLWNTVFLWWGRGMQVALVCICWWWWNMVLAR